MCAIRCDPIRSTCVGLVLAGLGIGGLAFGLSVMGLDFLARRRGRRPDRRRHIVDDRSTCFTRGARLRRCSTCRCSRCRPSAPASIGGFMFRLGIGALPFLLPLLLQIGFHLSPFQSGLITFTGALGSMFMKAAVTRVLAPLRLSQRADLQRAHQRRLPRRLRDASFPACRSAAMVAMLLTGGFFRSLQFTSINTIAYAEIEPHADEPRHRAGRGRAAIVAVDRRRGRRAGRRDHAAAEAGSRR